MGLLKKYDPKHVTITFDGLVLNEGIVKGTFITVERNEPNSSVNVGGDGGSTMVIGHDHSGTARLTLRAGSVTNDTLTDIVLKDESNPDDKRVGAFQVEDFSGRTKHIDAEAFLSGPPSDEKGTEEGAREWTFVLPRLTMEARGNSDALTVTA